MGSKAKKAITDASSAIAAMKARSNDMIAGFQGMYNQKKITGQFRNDLIAYAQKKYPGKNNLSAEVAADAALMSLFQNIEKSKTSTRTFRQTVLANSLLLKDGVKNARAAIAELDKLIQAKVGKQNSAGKNPLMKIVASAKTKSLGDLRDKKRLVDQAIADVNANTIGIIAYAEKKLAKE